MSMSICIFAHNEERLLPSCIAALDDAAAGAPFHAHILVNGSTDTTLGVARTLAAADPRITVHNLPIPDKANAWNDYVYRIARHEDVHIFLDGDIAPAPRAFAELAATLKENPRAYAAAALPFSGRDRAAWADRLRRLGYLSGNLYAMTETALAAFRARDLQLPFGAKGEDGLIAYLLLTDLEGGEDDTHRDRIAVAENAGFEFNSLALNWNDAQIYHRRLKRYSERHFQKAVLYRRLKRGGVAAMPKNIFDIYAPAALCGLRPRRDPINFWYDWATLRRLRAAHRKEGEPFRRPSQPA